VGFGSYMQLRLPSWWHLKAECQATEMALRNLNEGERPEVPMLEAVSGLARLLLPIQIDRPDLRDMESTFLEQELKGLVHRIQSDFGPVIILIDDMDALSDEQQTDFLRVLRPLSKIKNVICVITAPFDLYDKLKNGDDDLSDVHSTVHDIYVMGIPTLFELTPPSHFAGHMVQFRFSHIRNKTQNDVAYMAVTEFVEELLVANMRFPLLRTGASPSCVQHLLKNWDRKYLADILAGLKNNGASKREVLRELEKMANFSQRTPFSP
jgi:hypothetical protein